MVAIHIDEDYPPAGGVFGVDVEVWFGVARRTSVWTSGATWYPASGIARTWRTTTCTRAATPH